MANLERKIETLVVQADVISKGVHEALEADLKNERRKMMVFSIVVLFTIAYMTWMTFMIRQVDADIITTRAVLELQDAMPRTTERIAEFLEEKIPQLGEDLKGYTSDFSWIADHAHDIFEGASAQLQSDIKDNVTGWMLDTHEAILVNLPESEHHRAREVFMEDFSKGYKNKMISLLEDEKTALNEHFTELESYLKTIATSDSNHLTKRQIYERDLIQAVAALVQISVAEGTDEADGN